MSMRCLYINPIPPEMKENPPMRMIKIVALPLILYLGTMAQAHAEEEIYYARCNLKVLKGTYITWVNWQAAPEMIPVNTELKVSGSGNKLTVVEPASGKSYTLDLGNQGQSYMEKFVSRTPVKMDKFPKAIRDNIKKAVARVDMTKAQVYIAMGPPAWISGGNTNVNTYEEIMKANLWVYKRRRFGKNIGVEFDAQRGTVIHTEGIWR